MTLDTTFNDTLKILLPTLCGIVSVLVLCNIYVISQQNISQRPSLRIYLNMIVIDMVAVVGGVVLRVDLQPGDHESLLFLWDNSIRISFYAGLTLFLVLVLTRIYIVHRPMGLVTNGTKLALLMIGVSWIVALVFFGLHILFHFPDYSRYPALSAAQSGIILLLGTCTTVLNMYIVMVTVRSTTRLQNSANCTAVLLFANNMIFYSFAMCLNGYFLYSYVSRGAVCENVNSEDVWDYLVCTKLGRHKLELVMLLGQALGNNILLVAQKGSRFVIEDKVLLIYDIFRTTGSLED